jgi:hypothetical protein
MKLKTQLKMEIKEPANKNVFELTRSSENWSSSSVIRNFIALSNQFK